MAAAAAQPKAQPKTENDGLFPNLQPELRNMSAWEEFFAHDIVKGNMALYNHAIAVSRMGVTFKAFKKILNNEDSFKTLTTMQQKKLTGQ